jgi:hypothetical protein
VDEKEIEYVLHSWKQPSPLVVRSQVEASPYPLSGIRIWYRGLGSPYCCGSTLRCAPRAHVLTTLALSVVFNEWRIYKCPWLAWFGLQDPAEQSLSPGGHLNLNLATVPGSQPELPEARGHLCTRCYYALLPISRVSFCLREKHEV